MPKIKRKHVVILILLIVAVYIITTTVPMLKKVVTPTTIIKNGELKIGNEVTGYVLRDETVYGAKSEGNVEYKVKEGDLVKVGTTVISFTKSESSSDDEDKKYKGDVVDSLGKALKKTDSSQAQRKGVFSTYIDGYENYFKVDNFDKITEKKASKKTNNVEKFKAGSVKANQPMYKLTDQSIWYILCWIDSEDVSKYEEGNSVTVQIDDDEIKFNIEKIEVEGYKWKVLLKCNRYYEDFAKIRKADISLVATSREGLLVPNKCITTKKKQQGVYVVSKTGDTSFVPINVKATDGENSIVSETSFYDEDGNLVNTVSIYDEILNNPKKEK